MKVTAHRLTSGLYELRSPYGRILGTAWRMQKKSRGFGFRVFGVYWRNGLYNFKGGSVACRAGALKEVCAVAAHLLMVRDIQESTASITNKGQTKL